MLQLTKTELRSRPSFTKCCFLIEMRADWLGQVPLGFHFEMWWKPIAHAHKWHHIQAELPMWLVRLVSIIQGQFSTWLLWLLRIIQRKPSVSQSSRTSFKYWGASISVETFPATLTKSRKNPEKETGNISGIEARADTVSLIKHHPFYSGPLQCIDKSSLPGTC